MSETCGKPKCDCVRNYLLFLNIMIIPVYIYPSCIFLSGTIVHKLRTKIRVSRREKRNPVHLQRDTLPSLPFDLSTPPGGVANKATLAGAERTSPRDVRHAHGTGRLFLNAIHAESDRWTDRWCTGLYRLIELLLLLLLRI